MFTTKNKITSIKDIPDSWIYKNYLNLDIANLPTKISSPFRIDDNASFGFFTVENGSVLWKDLRTRESGNALSLALKFILLKNPGLTKEETIKKLREDFAENKNSIEILPAFAAPLKKKLFKIKEVKRHWNKSDKEFWEQFKITLNDLNLANVIPLYEYLMTVNEKSFVIKNTALYGYYTKKGELYKIYQPLNKDQKFITVNASIIEGEGFERGFKYRGLLSSKKDILSFNKLELYIDSYAPNSETTYLTKEEIKRLKLNFTCLDNDPAGIEAMLYYKENYNIPFVYLNYEKDVSDAIKKYGVSFIKEIIVPKINNII